MNMQIELKNSIAQRLSRVPFSGGFTYLRGAMLQLFSHETASSVDTNSFGAIKFFFSLR